ncbi:hypothetical protein O6R05_05185 [Peptoniphilus equinus]|uniref:Bacteriocin-type signal sequence-containing protein n=1 Tax=Peptoniphilus equinus TaxID=3016343 RepID=A0ABY7QTS4_9FIRM|nr:hypothetical protein [Peptoniphilus equinus]WBW49405.1 hypothetical protein O6R05_05185 [Peptoniphilus equinus]
MNKENTEKKQTLKIVKVNGTKNDMKEKGFFLCGGDDVCSWYDGVCNPKYH